MAPFNQMKVKERENEPRRNQDIGGPQVNIISNDQDLPQQHRQERSDDFVISRLIENGDDNSQIDKTYMRNMHRRLQRELLDRWTGKLNLINPQNLGRLEVYQPALRKMVYDQRIQSKLSFGNAGDAD